MLKGDLVTTPLPAVLRQLADGVVSGCLHVDDGVGGTAKVYLRGGQVYAVQVPGRRPQLGARLVSSGALGPEALAEALEAQRTELQGWRLGELLVHLGFVDQPVVEAFVNEQVREQATDLMRWPTGTWKFRVNERTREDVAPPRGVEELLADVEQRMAQWDVITEVLHGPEAVPMLSAAGQTDDEMSIDPDAWSLLCKVDGVRSVADLARECGFTLFEAGQVVYSLVRSGLLEVEEVLVGAEAAAAPVSTDSVASRLAAAFAPAEPVTEPEAVVEEVVIPHQAEEPTPAEVAALVANALREDRTLEAPAAPGDDEIDASVGRVSQALSALLGEATSTEDMFAAPTQRAKGKAKTAKPKTASEIEREKKQAARAEAQAKRRARDAEELALAQAELEAARAAEAEAAAAQLEVGHEAEVVSLEDARKASEERAAAEAEAARLAAEEAARLAEEEAARAAAEERARVEAELREQAEAQAAAEAEAARVAAEEEAARLAEEERLAREAEAARVAAEEEAARLAEEARLAQEAAELAAAEERARVEAELREQAERERQAEEEAARLAAEAEAARIAAEEEAARLAEEARLAQEAAELAAAEERARVEAELREQAERERLAEEEAARLAEEARLAQEAAELAAAEERARVEAELREQAEAQAAAEAARVAEEERLALEAAEAAEAEAARLAAEREAEEQARSAEQRAHEASAFAELSATAATAGDTLVAPAAVDVEELTDDELLDEVDDEPMPVYAPQDTDMASLFRELSSLGIEDAPSEPAPPPRSAPRPAAPQKAKKKGLFGR